MNAFTAKAVKTAHLFSVYSLKMPLPRPQTFKL